jgi:hypothetical protein
MIGHSEYSIMASSSMSPASTSSSPQLILCTEDTAQTRARKRQKVPTLNSYSCTNSMSSGITQRQHTQYQVHGDGSISYTRKYVQPPKNAQPTKRCEPLVNVHVQHATNTQPPIIPDEPNEPLADISESWGTDYDAQQPRRRRTAGVSPQTESHFIVADMIQDHPLLMWLKDRALFLQEMLRLEGRGDLSAEPCSGCSDSHPEYRCEDCFGIDLRCSSCIVAAHKHHPLHWLQVGTADTQWCRA